MKIKKYLVAGGNSTALVYDCPIDKRREISINLLEKVEQVGFISTNNFPELQMMGNELCINGTLALASTLGKEGKMKTSGVRQKIFFLNDEEKTTIQIPLKFKKVDNIILFEGIGFILFDSKEKTDVKKKLALNLCDRYNLPAFGVIIYENNRITPYIYVKEVDSFVKETACGSGSIAFSILTDRNEVIQPTGEKIWVEVEDQIKVSARVTKGKAIDI